MGAPTGTVTFLFTDVVRSTALWEAHPREMAAAVARHDEILRAAIERHAGYVFSTGGDGFGVAFDTAAAAVATAIDAQRALSREPWADETPVRVRMGVNTGEAQERGGDYFGVPLNRAARTMALAAGGQIVLSEVTASLLTMSEPDVEVVPLGSFELRGVAATTAMYGIRAPGVVAPTPHRGDARVVRTAALPRFGNEFVGHALDLKLIAAELPARDLVTLTGAGGVGKTRWAVEIAGLALGDYPDGAWFVDLAPVANPLAVANAVAAQLGIHASGGSALDAVAERFRDKRALFVLDNCEHVLEASASLVSHVGQASAHTTVLVTSREPLGLRDERVHVVKSLDPSIDGLALFCDRAGGADADLAFSDDDLGAIAKICERLDGIPLAIELAAARLTTLSPSEILDRLNDRFRLLRSAPRDAIERHRTLQTAVVWSYQMLDEAERTMFDRLSVFPGSFDLSAVEAVCAGGDIDGDDVLDLLTALVRKSLVYVVRGEGSVRYRLLETLRSFGEDRLAERGETAELRDRHYEHYMDRFAIAHADLNGREAFRGGEVFAREWDSFRALVAWATATANGERMAEAIQTSLPYMFQWGSVEHLTWVLAAADAVAGDDPDRPNLLANATMCTLLSGGDLGRAGELAREAYETMSASETPAARSLRHRAERLDLVDRIKIRAEDIEEFNCRNALVYALLAEGRFEDGLEMMRDVAARAAASPLYQAYALYELVALSVRLIRGSPEPPTPAACEQLLRDAERMHAVAREVGPLFGSAGLFCLASAHLAVGRAAEALEYGRRSLDAAGPMLSERASALQILAQAAASVADESASRHFVAALTELRALGLWGFIWDVLQDLVAYWFRLGRPEPVAVIMGFADERGIEPYMTPSWKAALDEVLVPDDVSRSVDRGRTMTNDELIAYVLRELGDGAPVDLVAAEEASPLAHR